MDILESAHLFYQDPYDYIISPIDSTQGPFFLPGLSYSSSTGGPFLLIIINLHATGGLSLLILLQITNRYVQGALFLI